MSFSIRTRSIHRILSRSVVVPLAVALGASSAAASYAGPPVDSSSTASAAAEPAEPLFGGTAYRESGESYRQAYLRVTAKYGGMDALRTFYPGMPASWSTINANSGDTPVVVSFKAGTSMILSGQHDAQLRRWFAEAPTGRLTYWTYWHEPENDTVDKAAYRRAWAHIAALADQARNPRLHATMILMCWTLNPHSGRDWHDYYAGGDVIDVMAFDCYNKGFKNGVYLDPRRILTPVVEAAASAGKPWGIAEFGSKVVYPDGGFVGRAQWLREFGASVRALGGTFATYFDSSVGGDFRLKDQPSIDAWTDVIHD